MSIWDTLKTTTGYNMINSFMNPDEPYKQGQKAENEGYYNAQQYQQPYWQHGNDQYQNLYGAEQNLLDPEKLQAKWAEGYQTSPYAQRMLQMNQGQGLDAASSMGLEGSSGALQNIQQGAGDIVSKDRREYLNDLMQKYMAGIGIGQNIYNTGAGAGSDMAGHSMRHGENMSQLKYGQYGAPGEQFSKIAGAAGTAAMNLA